MQIKRRGRRFRSEKEISKRQALVRKIIQEKNLEGTTQGLKLHLIGPGGVGFSHHRRMLISERKDMFLAKNCTGKIPRRVHSNQ